MWLIDKRTLRYVITYVKTDSNNKNIFRNSRLTLSWKALHAAIKDNQNNLDMYFVKFTELTV